MPEDSGEGLVWVDYHQFYLLPDSSLVDWDGETSNGLIQPLRRAGAIILTGIACGRVRYEWATHDTRPPAILHEWDDVAEIIISTPPGGLHVEGWGSMTRDDVDLARRGFGTHVVRCSARRRDRELDLAVEGVASEEYRIELWPAIPADSAQILRDSGFARAYFG